MGTIRFFDNEMHWGKEGCPSCGGRGWVTASESDGQKVGNCAACCNPRTTNEEVLLEERLAIVVHYSGEDLLAEMEIPEGAVLH
jgi:hypothetical protein